MIYLDNSATSWHKPNAVIEATTNVIKYLSANPGRSGHRLAVMGEKIVYSCRENIGTLFNAPYEKVIFTKNCTESLNTAIFGLYKKGKKVITTIFEHNSVLRPLYELEKRGEIELEIISPTADNSLLDNLINAINNKDVGLVVINSASNVTGEILPFSKVGKVCKDKNIPFIVDGAQGGGHIKIDIKKDNISALCLAGHKGLYGIMGSGILILDKNTEIKPLTFGGTGIDTFNKEMPAFYPERLEAGTLNLPAIAGLNEGVKYVNNAFTQIENILVSLTEKTIEGLSNINNVFLYSTKNPFGIVSFCIKDMSSQTVSDILNSEYDIAVRGGYHCAPLTHKFLHTEENGLVRASFSVFNNYKEVDLFVKAVKRIACN